MKKKRGKEETRWRRQLRAGLLGLGVAALTQFGVAGQVDTPFCMTVKAWEWGNGDNVTATVSSKDYDKAANQSSFANVYAGQTIEQLTFSWDNSTFEDSTEEDGASCYEAYNTRTGKWSKATGSFQKGYKYRFKLVLKPNSDNSIEKGLKLWICENYTNSGDKELWVQDESSPNVFYSPEITCNAANAWDSVNTANSAYAGGKLDNPAISIETAFPDKFLLAEVKKAKSHSGDSVVAKLNNKDVIYRLNAQQVTSFSLSYTEDVGDNMLKGIEYFPFLRSISIDAHDQAGIKTLDLSKNQYLTKVVIRNYAGGSSVKLPSSVRELIINGCKVGNPNGSLNDMTKLHTLQIVDTDIVSPNLEKSANLKSIRISDATTMQHVTFCKGIPLETASFQRCESLKNLDFKTPSKVEDLKITECPSLLTLTVNNAAIKNITAPDCNALNKVDLSGCEISDKVNFNKCTSLNTLLAAGTVFDSNATLQMQNCGFTTLNMQSTACSPVFAQNSKLDLSYNSKLTGVTLPVSNGAYAADCKNCALTGFGKGAKKSEIWQLHCEYNQIKDVLDLTGCVAARDGWDLYCSNNSNLTDIKVNGTLRTLSAGRTGIKTFEVNGSWIASGAKVYLDACAALTSLSIKNCNAGTVTATNETALGRVTLNNSSTSVDLTNDTALKGVEFIGKNTIPALTAKGATVLQNFGIPEGDNTISDIDFKDCTALQVVEISTGHVKKLDCDGCEKLSSLFTGSNSTLEELYCGGASLKALDVTRNSALRRLSIKNTQIQTLDVSKNPRLKYLNCAYCPITVLDLSKNTYLQELNVDHTQIADLNLSACESFDWLDCDDSGIEKLTLATVRVLHYSDNHLAALDLTGMKSGSSSYLKGTDTKNVTTLNNYLDCSVLAAGMDVSRVEVTDLYVSGSKVDVSKCTKRDNGLLLPKNTTKVCYNYSTGQAATAIAKLSVELTITSDRGLPMIVYDACGGKVTPESESVNGTTKKVKSLPTPTRENYEFEGWFASADYAENTKVTNDTVYDRDTRLYAKWKYVEPEKQEYTIIANASEGGKVEGGNATYQEGETVTIKAVPFKGYSFDHWQKDGADIAGGETLTFTAQEDAAYVAVFKQEWEKCTVTVEATEGGSVKGGGTCVAGASITLEAEAFEGYEFVKWQKYGEDTANAAKFTHEVSGNEEWKAVFEKKSDAPAVTSHTVKIMTSEGGTTSGAGTFKEGSEVTVYAAADEGYVFDGWYDNDGIPVSNETEYKFNLTADMILYAEFKKTGDGPSVKTYRVTINESEGGSFMMTMGSLGVPGVYKANEEMTVKAIAADGYQFKGWKKDGTIVETKAEYTFSVTGNTTLEPVFEKASASTPTPAPAESGTSVTEPGAGTISADGKTITDTTGKEYRVADTVANGELKKGLTVADKKSGGKYRITKIVEMVSKGGIRKVTGGEVEYVAPYNKDTDKIAATGKVKLAGVNFTVTSIAPNCAAGCGKLKKVVLGTDIAKIGKNAFKGCKNLKSIQIKSKKLKKVGGGAFKGIHKKAVIKVPKAKANAYKKLLKGKTNAKIK